MLQVYLLLLQAEPPIKPLPVVSNARDRKATQSARSAQSNLSKHKQESRNDENDKNKSTGRLDFLRHHCVCVCPQVTLLIGVVMGRSQPRLPGSRLDQTPYDTSSRWRFFVPDGWSFHQLHGWVSLGVESCKPSDSQVYCGLLRCVYAL